MITALRTIQPQVGQAAFEILRSPQPPPLDLLLPDLLNEIAPCPSQAILVLDDYHTITSAAVHESLEFLLEHSPRTLQVVISSRTDPPLPLARLRANNRLMEIRATDLRFTPEEVETFLNQVMGLRLSRETLAQLEEQTEGWIAGLQLVALSLQNMDDDCVEGSVAGFSGRHHYVLDYLADEVLKRQSPSTQTFLLNTSILERMSPSLCDTVMEHDQSQDVLTQLEHANLFVVPLDTERQWYRYHHLFRDLLHARLQAERAAPALANLHRRAASWYQANGFAVDAINHAFAAADFNLAADPLERGVTQGLRWSSGDIATISYWYTMLPREILKSRPYLWIHASRMMYASGYVAAADQLFQELEQSIDSLPHGTPEADRVLGLVWGTRARLSAAIGEIRRAIEAGQKSLALFPADYAAGRTHSAAGIAHAYKNAGNVIEAEREIGIAIAEGLASGFTFNVILASWQLAEIKIVRGQLSLAAQVCEQALQRRKAQEFYMPVAGLPMLPKAAILRERNELQLAEQCVLRGLELLRQAALTDYWGLGYALLASIRQALGNEAGARFAMQQAESCVRASGLERAQVLMSAHRARFSLWQRDLPGAVAWAEDYASGARAKKVEYLRDVEDMILARIYPAQGRPRQALEILDELLPSAEAAGRMGRVIEMQVLRSLTLQLSGERSKALEALKAALELGEPEGYVRVFVDAGEPLAEMLKQAALHHLSPGYLHQLMAALPPRESGLAPSDRPALPDALTPRELEVLRFLSQGLSNREIADKLFLSPNALRAYTYNIYGKLGVHNRTQAVAQARQLGLLPSSA